MAAPLDPSVFKPALIVLGAAAVVIPVFHRLKLSPVLGFILVGLAVGPHGAGSLEAQVPWLGMVTLTDTHAVAAIGELGVVMLMFMIGLEMSFQRLRVMRRLVFGLGPLQMAVCTPPIAAALWAFGVDPAAALVIALAVAISSTAVVLQVLSDAKRMGGTVGRASLGVLLFQDLAAVPILVAVGLVGSAPSPDDGIWLPIAEAIGVVAAIGLGGRVALRPLFRSVARTGSPELFVAACLLVVLGTSVAGAAVGLPPALGALIAGLMLAETEFRRQVEVTIEPFKGLLVGVFLVSVGMTLDLGVLALSPLAVLGATVGLILLKAGLVAALARGFGLRWGSALQVGLLLGPSGEFGFVILGLGLAVGLLDAATTARALAVVALGIAAIPVLHGIGRRLDQGAAPAAAPENALPAALPEETGPAVVIAGFGRVGKMVAHLLEVHAIPYIAIDNDPDSVAAERRRGRNVYWGDITLPDLLRRLHIDQVRALVVTMSNVEAAETLVANARAARPELLIVARARDARHAARLYSLGATDAVPETIEASLQLSEAVLVDMGIPMGPVIASIHEERARTQTDIRAMAPDANPRPLGHRRLRDALPKG